MPTVANYLVHLPMCCFSFQVRGHPCQGNLEAEATEIPHWKMEKVESIGGNGEASSSKRGEIKNGLMKQKVCCVCPESRARTGTPGELLHFVVGGKIKNHSPTKIKNMPNSLKV